MALLNDHCPLGFITWPPDLGLLSSRSLTQMDLRHSMTHSHHLPETALSLGVGYLT